MVLWKLSEAPGIYLFSISQWKSKSVLIIFTKLLLAQPCTTWFYFGSATFSLNGLFHSKITFLIQCDYTPYSFITVH